MPFPRFPHAVGRLDHLGFQIGARARDGLQQVLLTHLASASRVLFGVTQGTALL